MALDDVPAGTTTPDIPAPRLGDVVADIRAKAQLMYGSQSPASLVRALAADGASAVFLFRAAQLFARWRLAPLAWLATKLNKLMNGITIGVGARIGRGFAIQHSVGIVINRSAVIGPGCVLESGVVIGAVDRRSPELGAGVYVGSGAKVIGGVRVGAGSRIGANAVVVKDVPPGSTAVGIPARIL